VNADDAKLTEDEDSEAAAATTTTTTTPASTTTTTAPTHSGTGGTGSSGGTATITADQNTLTTDQAKTSADQQKEAADLAQAESTCGTATTPPSSTTTTTTTPANAAACSADLQQASNDQQQVSADQRQVSKDEATLAQALGDGSSTSGNPTSSSGPAPGSTSTTSTTVATTTPTTSTVSGTGNTGRGDDDAAAGVGAGTGAGTPTSSEGAASDSPEEIASDQAAIDTAQANLIEAQQALAEATLSSPITGTIASVGVTVGDTVSADSSTAVIVIIGTQSFEVSGTLTSSQVSSVKVAQTADVEVDGVSAGITGTVSQVGPVQSGTSGYSYPVVVALPTTTQGLFSGSTANVTIATGQVTNVVAVPTSAVITAGTSSYVLTLSGGTLGRTVIKVGMVGSTYTQVLSGLKVGDAVVLADLAEAVPSSNTATLGGFGGGGGFGGAGGFTGGTGRFTRTVVGGGGLGG
jgi:hypothetical protein